MHEIVWDERGIHQGIKDVKIWGMEENGGQTSKHHHHHTNHDEGGKGLFLTDAQWPRGTPWSTASNASEHAVSQPIMMTPRRSGSYPGSDAPSMLSPRSTDTGGLGVKMVEYVLGTSPTSRDLDSRLGRMNINDMKEKNKKTKSYENDGHKSRKDEISGGVMQDNGIMQNGIEDESGKGFNRTPGSHQNQGSPNEDELCVKGQGLNDVVKLGKNNMADGLVPGGMLHGSGGMAGMTQHFGDNQFDAQFDATLGMDQLQFNDYSNHMMHSIDSPGILDYGSQQLYQQRPNQTQGQLAASLLPQHQQQYSLAAAQQQSQGMPPPHAQSGMAPQGGNGSNPFPQNPYYQDPFAAQMSHLIPAGPPPIVPQYYGITPWGMYPGMIAGGQGQPHQGPPPHVQQQQMMRGNGTRPLTPQGPNDSTTSGQNMTGGQYPIMHPHGYYDQNGSLMMNNSAAARGMNPAAMRLIPPMIMNQAAANNNLRMMSGAGQGVQGHGGPPPNGMFSSNSNNVTNSQLTASNNNVGYSNASGNQMGAMNGPNGNHLNFGGNIGHSGSTVGQGYGNNGLGPIGPSLSSGIGNNSPRRESFDSRRDASGLGGGMFSGLEAGQFSRHVGAKNGQFYGSTIAPSPGPIGMMPTNQSLTPPPSLNGSNGSLNLGSLGGRMMSAAPGAEAKYLVRNGQFNGNVFGSSNSVFSSNRILQRNSSLDKATGRSRLLEDFRNNRFPNLQLRDLNDHIVEFSQDQHGSRFIQQKLERASPTEKQMVFNEIIGAAYNLMTDVFGNYVIQKFFEFGTAEQKQALAMKVKGHVLPLALQMYGCRVIQKALESIPTDQQKEIVKELDGHILKCVKDQNGNHVVQKCIECVDPHALQFIINAFAGQVYALSTHPYGCRVIQRILEHCTPEQTSPILEELHSHVEQLVQDQYGNYVVQHVLEHGRQEDKAKIIANVRGKTLQLSQHKFASNVVEKCVTHASRVERSALIEEVCSFNDSALYTMMKDQYANYVVQKMIEVAESSHRKLLLQRIRPHLPALRKYTYGKHILAKLEKYMMKNNDLGPIGPPSIK